MRPFRTGPWAWLVLAANAVPVVGVYLLGWSQGLAVVSYWVDGVSLLICLLVAVVPGTVARMPTQSAARRHPLPSMALMFLIGLALLGIPYWVSLVALGLRLSGPALWREAAGSPLASLSLLGLVATNAANVALRRYGSRPDAEVTRSLHWEFHLMLLRVAAQFAVALFLPRRMVLGLAILMSYAEIFPLRAMRLLGAPLREGDVPAQG